MTAFTSTLTDSISPYDGSGLALKFDGSQNYVSLGTLGNLGSNIGSGFYCKLTIQTKQISLGSLFGVYKGGVPRVFVYFNNGGSGRIQFLLYDNAGLLLAGITTSATSVNDGGIHTVIITASPSTNTITISVGGIDQPISYNAQQTPVAFANLNSNFILAGLNNNDTPGTFLSCAIDNFQIGTSSSSLYGSYNFNDGANPTADQSGNGNTGSLQGSPLPSFVLGFDPSPINTSKFPSDSISLAEAFSHLATLSRNLSDSISFTETIIKGYISTGYTNSIALIESMLKSNSKAFSDSISPSEIFTKAYTTIYSSSISLTETMLKLASKTLSGSISLVETFSPKQIGRFLSESIPLSESFQKQTAKFFTETLSITEIIAKITNYVMSLTDSIILSETFSRLLGRPLTDSISLVESFTRTFLKSFTEVIMPVYILLENGFHLLQENGDKILFEPFAETFSKADGKVFSDRISILEKAIRQLRRGKLFRRLGQLFVAGE